MPSSLRLPGLLARADRTRSGCSPTCKTGDSSLETCRSFLLCSQYSLGSESDRRVGEESRLAPGRLGRGWHFPSPDPLYNGLAHIYTKRERERERERYAYIRISLSLYIYIYIYIYISSAGRRGGPERSREHISTLMLPCFVALP